MKLGRCFFCNKLSGMVYHVTEIEDGKVESVDLCARCGQEYLQSLEDSRPRKGTDLSHIKTPEDLLTFISSLAPPKKPVHEPCPGCGTTVEIFDQCGRFGCPRCYDHFKLIIDKVVCPYHKADHHVGKHPKHAVVKQTEKDPVEKMKLLKLQLAKAIELEEYERAAEINTEIKQLTASFPSFFSDQ